MQQRIQLVFFLKKILSEIWFFNTKYKCSADYDLYYRLLITKKINGGFTKKTELIGEVMSGGFSSKISFLEHLLEETQIRIDNKQNLLIIIIILFNSLIKRFFKFFKSKIFFI